MKKIISFVFVLSILHAFSQNIPQLKIKDKKDLKLTGLKIDIEIVGNYARTTYDMLFYNSYNRVLEGELVFPLAQGQSVSNFAMEVNGAMREAVVVEKTQARVAYKNTMVQRIDPGLLEKTEGNNYKARIYPIQPDSYKRIVITTEELLPSENSEKIYRLPLNFKDKLKSFTINAVVESTYKPYAKPNPFPGFDFVKKKGKYVAHWASKKNYRLAQSLRILIPEAYQQPEVITYRDYFYVYLPLQKNYKPKPRPKHIAVYWDASLSGSNRDTEEEINLLSDYIKYLQDVDVDLYVFSSALRQKHSLKIKKGKTKALKDILDSVVYDGGTDFSSLNRIDTSGTDEILLFSDGLNNLGDWTQLPAQPVYTINSAVNAHHDLLQKTADATGGAYINLNRIDRATALDNLKILPLIYQGITSNEHVYEVYPPHRKSVQGSMVLAGRFDEPVSFTVNFGYGAGMDFNYQVDLSRAESNALAKRLWAKQKLDYLQENPEKNKKQIIALATRYHLISDYTSMIILDRLEDYVRYGIEPPAELKARYKELMVLREKDKVQEKAKEQEIFEDLQAEYREILDWYREDVPKEVTETQTQENPQTGQQPDNRETQEQEEVRHVPARSATRAYTGFVYDKRGGNNDPLPGVNVVIKGTAYGTATDFDGKFSIGVKTGDTLVFTFIGYIPQEHVVGNENSKKIYLKESGEKLEEVVVTALGVQVSRRSEKAVSVSYVKAKALAGKVEGISINRPENIIISGRKNLILNKKPLYLLDGKEISTKEMEKYDPDNIGRILVVKPPVSVQMYGRKARHGAILIFTETYLKTHSEEVAKLEKQIEDARKLKPVGSQSAYLNRLKQAENIEQAYNIYLDIRDDYLNKPVFFIDVSDYFYQKGKKDLAIRIITNLLELKLANHELSRALAYKLEAYGAYDMAVKVYQNVLKLRPEEPQSYRDLALAYEQAGKYQKSFDLLYNMYKGKYHGISGNGNYDGIEQIAFVELHHLVSLHGDKIKLPEDAKIFKEPMPMDIRVVIDWNHNDTDIDLWVFDPNDEKAYYKHKKTAIGGLMSEDFTDGYGPESFKLKKAIKGMYTFEVNYYADSKQKISGPTILKVTIFKKYGTPEESRKVLLTRLDKGDDHMEVGSLNF